MVALKTNDCCLSLFRISAIYVHSAVIARFIKRFKHWCGIGFKTSLTEPI